MNNPATIESPSAQPLIELDVAHPVWDRFFWVAPLVLIGTREADGRHDLAPKHMALPLGWDNYFGFVCTPRHHTYANAQRSGEFTVSYPRPAQLVLASLAASPRCGEEDKPALAALPVFPARAVDGVLLEGGYLFLECALERIVDGFGVNSLIVGRIVAARVAADSERIYDGGDDAMISKAPILAYLHPGRIATIEKTLTFPFPAGMEK
jgi:flavin reductase (DIM6/NTAB) family NADH-FMN oxidoreductase RutF